LDGQNVCLIYWEQLLDGQNVFDILRPAVGWTICVFGILRTAVGQTKCVWYVENSRWTDKMCVWYIENSRWTDEMCVWYIENSRWTDKICFVYWEQPLDGRNVCLVYWEQPLDGQNVFDILRTTVGRTKCVLYIENSRWTDEMKRYVIMKQIVCPNIYLVSIDDCRLSFYYIPHYLYPWNLNSLFCHSSSTTLHPAIRKPMYSNLFNYIIECMFLVSLLVSLFVYRVYSCNPFEAVISVASNHLMPVRCHWLDQCPVQYKACTHGYSCGTVSASYSASNLTFKHSPFIYKSPLQSGLITFRE
jgi:hypothetical protein